MESATLKHRRFFEVNNLNCATIVHLGSNTIKWMHYPGRLRSSFKGAIGFARSLSFSACMSWLTFLIFSSILLNSMECIAFI
jgi:hypothetical protein